jgi:uncharacterized CHY-type Zn-finger protein
MARFDRFQPPGLSDEYYECFECGCKFLYHPAVEDGEYDGNICGSCLETLREERTIKAQDESGEDTTTEPS